MTDTLVGVVVAHGAVAEALVAAAEEISGIRGALIPVSNAGLGREDLEQRLAAAPGGDLRGSAQRELPLRRHAGAVGP